MTALFTLANQIPVQSSGAPYGSAKLYFYRAGTTTQQNVYTTAALSTAHDQPVQADTAGVFAPIFLDPGATYDYRYQLKTSADVLIKDVDNYPKSGFPTQAQLGAILYPRTAAEIAAGVTPTNYFYPPKDIRRYGAAIDNSTNDLQSFIDCLAANGCVEPWNGRAFVGNGAGLIFTSEGMGIHGNSRSELRYTGTGTLVNFGGFDMCGVTGVRIFAPNATQVIYVGSVAHGGKVLFNDIRGSSNGDLYSGTVSAGNAVVVERSFYVQVFGNDISSFERGVYGLNECNGNFVTCNSIRRCRRGVHMTDDTGVGGGGTTNSDGCQIADNEIEGGESGDIAAIDVQGCSNMMIHHNRLEYSPNGTAHIFVHDGANDAIRHSIEDNHCGGSVVSVKLGDNSGSSRVSLCAVRGGYYAHASAGAITIGQDCDYCEVDLPSTRYIASGAADLLVNNSTTTILSILNDQTEQLTLTGCTTSPTTNVLWSINKNVVMLDISGVTATSNTTAATLTTLSALVRPTATRHVVARIYDNSASVAGLISIGTNGVITLTNTIAGGGAMTNGNDKGVLSMQATYKL